MNMPSKKESMIEWIIEATDNSAVNNRIHNQKKDSQFERLHHRIDDILMYCKNCERVWQKNRKMMSRNWESYPKNHIPIIGKQKKQCPNCKEEK